MTKIPIAITVFPSLTQLARAHQLLADIVRRLLKESLLRQRLPNTRFYDDVNKQLPHHIFFPCHVEQEDLASQQLRAHGLPPWASSAAQLLGLASVYRLLQECGFAQILRILSFFLPGLKGNTAVGSSTAQIPSVRLTNRPPTDSNCSPQVPACSLHAADITTDPRIFTSPHSTHPSPSQRPPARL